MAQAYTDDEILTELRAAVVVICTAGQSYSVAGRTYTRANLADLQKLVDKYEARIAAATGADGGGFVLTSFARPV